MLSFPLMITASMNLNRLVNKGEELHSMTLKHSSFSTPEIYVAN